MTTDTAYTVQIALEDRYMTLDNRLRRFVQSHGIRDYYSVSAHRERKYLRAAYKELFGSNVPNVAKQARRQLNP